MGFLIPCLSQGGRENDFCTAFPGRMLRLAFCRGLTGIVLIAETPRFAVFGLLPASLPLVYFGFLLVLLFRSFPGKRSLRLRSSSGAVGRLLRASACQNLLRSAQEALPPRYPRFAPGQTEAGLSGPFPARRRAFAGRCLAPHRHRSGSRQAVRCGRRCGTVCAACRRQRAGSGPNRFTCRPLWRVPRFPARTVLFLVPVSRSGSALLLVPPAAGRTPAGEPFRPAAGRSALRTKPDRVSGSSTEAATGARKRSAPGTTGAKRLWSFLAFGASVIKGLRPAPHRRPNRSPAQNPVGWPYGRDHAAVRARRRAGYGPNGSAADRNRSRRERTGADQLPAAPGQCVSKGGEHPSGRSGHSSGCCIRRASWQKSS